MPPEHVAFDSSFPIVSVRLAFQGVTAFSWREVKNPAVRQPTVGRTSPERSVRQTRVSMLPLVEFVTRVK
jgi:hypothetical protein